MTREEAKAFAAKWLPAWTGNQPERLASFYSEDAFYLDPALPEGIKGREPLLRYFRTLLGYNPDVFPMENGFLNKWIARIPVRDKVIECVGLCTVELNNGLISKNEVYFDRTELIAAIKGIDLRL
jgi:hypothetical protein